MKKAQKRDYKNALIITVDLRRWQRAALLAEFVRLHKKVHVFIIRIKIMMKSMIKGALYATIINETCNIKMHYNYILYRGSIWPVYLYSNIADKNSSNKQPLNYEHYVFLQYTV